MLKNPDGTIICEPFDILCILHNSQNNRFHVALFLESSLPSQRRNTSDKYDFIRLRMKATVTEGAETLEKAKEHLQKLRNSIIIPDENVTEIPLPWTGESGIVWMVGNWHDDEKTLAEVLKTFVGSVSFTTKEANHETES